MNNAGPREPDASPGKGVSRDVALLFRELEAATRNQRAELEKWSAGAEVTLEELDAEARAEMQSIELKLKELGQKKVPRAAPQWRMLGDKKKRIEDRLSVLSLMLAAESFKASLLSLDEHLQGKSEPLARLDLEDLREAAKNHTEFFRRPLRRIEAIFTTMSGPPSPPSPPSPPPPPPPPPPLAPAGVIASADSPEGVRLSWRPSEGATRYEVWRAGQPDTRLAVQIAMIPGAQTRFEDVSAPPGEEVYYWVKGRNDAGISTFGQAAAGRRAVPPPQPPPLPPSGVIATLDLPDMIAVRWQASAGAENYEIWRNDQPGARTLNLLGNTRAPGVEYHDTSATPGRDYTYCIKACSPAGVSDLSLPAQGRRLLPIPRLAAPASLAASVDLVDRVRLSWQPSENATGYEIWRSDRPDGGAPRQIASVAAPQTNYDDASPRPGQEAYYWVKARDSQKTSDYSVSAKGRRKPLTPPPTPASLSATEDLADLVRLSWESALEADSYEVWRCDRPTALAAVQIATVPAPQNTFSDDQVSPGADCFYWVKARNAGGASWFSPLAKGRRAPPPQLIVPGQLRASSDMPDRIRLEWDGTPDAIGYEAWRSNRPDGSSAVFIASIEAPLTTYDDTSASPGLNFYWVKAKYWQGESEFSEAAQGRRLWPLAEEWRAAEKAASEGNTAVLDDLLAKYPANAELEKLYARARSIAEAIAEAKSILAERAAEPAAPIETTVATRIPAPPPAAEPARPKRPARKRGSLIGVGVAVFVLLAVAAWVLGKPFIFVQPMDQQVLAGTQVNLEVLALSYVPMSYRWLFNGAPVSGATQASCALRVTETNAGRYQVVVSNSFGVVTSRVAQVTLPFPPPRIVGQPVDQRVLEGERFTNSVLVAGERLKYQWSCNGRPVAGATGSKLEIASASPSHAGGWEVLVWNVGGSVTSRSAQVDVLIRPAIASIRQEPPRAMVGEDVTLVAQAAGTGPLSYLWHSNNAPLPGTSSERLVLRSVELGTRAAYHVVVSNAVGRAVSPTLELVVTVPPPVITRDPADRTVNEGQEVELAVSVTGAERIQWYKDGVALPGATGPTWPIPRAATQHEGSYHVVASNSGGTATSGTARVTVRSKPAFRTHPGTLTVDDGDRVVLRAEADGTPPLTYVWRLNGRPIPGANSSEYEIVEAAKTNEGPYQVVVSNMAGSITSRTAQLKVNTVRLVIKQEPADATANEADQVTFSVNARGIPPISYQWSFNNQVIRGATNSVLTLADLKREQSGRYKADVSNPEERRSTRLATLTVVPGRRRYETNSLGMVFVSLPGKPLMISVYETRVFDYEAFASSSEFAGRLWARPDFRQGEAHPAVNVSWDDAHAFCRWLTEKERGKVRPVRGWEYRLPTDKEWSWVAGLPEETGETPLLRNERKTEGVYPWGNQWPPPRAVANYADRNYPDIPRLSEYDDGFPYTSPVGSFRENQYGIFDLGGNAAEWCDDTATAGDRRRVVRGGSYRTFTSNSALTAYRDFRAQVDRSPEIGFRIVLDKSGL